MSALAAHWESARGVHWAVVVPLEDISASPTDQDIRDYIEFIAIDNQLEYVLLVGDASLRLPERDVIPGHYVEWEGCYWDPVYSWDGWYGDLDDDGVAEIAVGRILAGSPSEAAIQIDKSISYDSSPSAEWKRRSLSLVEDMFLSGCNGDWARELADEAMSELPFPLNVENTTLYDSEIPIGYSNLEAAALQAWNSGVHLVYASGTLASRISLVEFFHMGNGFTADLLDQNFRCPIVLGTCCGLGNHARDAGSYPVELVSELQNAYGRGSLVWLAFTENTDQWTDYVVAREFLSRIDMYGSRSLGQIWLDVKDAIADDYPDAIHQLQMWSILGDPTIRMTWSHTQVHLEVAESEELVFCPSGRGNGAADSLTIVVSVRDGQGNPIQGVDLGRIKLSAHASSPQYTFSFACVDTPNILRPAEPTDELGRAFIPLYRAGGYDPEVELRVTVWINGVAHSSSAMIEAKSPDYYPNDRVDVLDLAEFAEDYGLGVGWRSDFDYDGDVDPTDLGQFCAHFGHGCDSKRTVRVPPELLESLELLNRDGARDAAPASFLLGRNQPNPFRGATLIAFGVPSAGGDVRVSVYDVAGRRVATLVDDQFGPGWYAAHWDGINHNGASVSSGVYFCVMEAPGFVDRHKLMLLR